jgi:hypothetical protein
LTNALLHRHSILAGDRLPVGALQVLDVPARAGAEDGLTEQRADVLERQRLSLAPCAGAVVVDDHRKGPSPSGLYRYAWMRKPPLG